METKKMFRYSTAVLEAFWYECMVKFENKEDEILLRYLDIIDQELKKRTKIS